jgi:cytochrome b561
LTNSNSDFPPDSILQASPAVPAPRWPASISVVFHWLAMAAMFGALAGGLFVHRLSPCCDVAYRPIYNLHASLGLIVLGLVGVRIVARLIRPWPGLHSDMSLWQSLLAEATHIALYVLMIALPLVGWSIISAPGCCYAAPFVFNTFTLPMLDSTPFPDRAAAFAVHSALAWVAMGAIALHAAAAFLHHFVFKDDTLARVIVDLRPMRSGGMRLARLWYRSRLAGLRHQKKSKMTLNKISKTIHVGILSALVLASKTSGWLFRRPNWTEFLPASTQLRPTPLKFLPVFAHRMSILSPTVPTSASTRKEYGDIMLGLSYNGKEVRAAVFNENEVRAAAGLTMALGAVAFVYAYFAKVYVPIQIITTVFFFEFLIRVTMGLKYSPMGVLARWMTQRQPPQWASAKPKRFAWTLGLIMSLAMMVITNSGIRGGLPFTICLICLTLMWLEAVLGLCLGCEIHGLMVRRGWAAKDDAFEVCAHGACAIQAPR